MKADRQCYEARGKWARLKNNAKEHRVFQSTSADESQNRMNQINAIKKDLIKVHVTWYDPDFS